MATKSSGSLDGDSSKSAGSLEKDPTAGAETDAASGYDYSDSSGGGYSYDGGGGSGGGTGGSSGGSGGGSGGSGSSGESGGSGDDATTDDDPGGTNERESDGSGEEDPGGKDSGDDGSSGDSGGDSGGGDSGGGDSGGDGDEPGYDFETLPGEGQLPENENPGDSEGPGSGGRVAVDIDLMITLIASMEQARDEIPELDQRMRTILNDLDIHLSEVAGLHRVTAWIEEELPGLRRRLAIARALEEGRLPRLPRPAIPLPRPVEPPITPGPAPPRVQPYPIETQPVEYQPGGRTPVIWDEDQVVTVEPHEASDNGRRAAALIGQPNGAGATEAAELLRSHQADPYFAREFASNTDPSLIVGSITEAEGGAGETDLRTLVQSTVATANQATGELAVDSETREAWAGALA